MSKKKLFNIKETNIMIEATTQQLKKLIDMTKVCEIKYKNNLDYRVWQTKFEKKLKKLG